MVERLKMASKYIDRALELLEQHAKDVDDPRELSKLETLLWKLLEIRIEISILRNACLKRKVPRSI